MEAELESAFLLWLFHTLFCRSAGKTAQPYRASLYGSGCGSRNPGTHYDQMDSEKKKAGYDGHATVLESPAKKCQ